MNIGWLALARKLTFPLGEDGCHNSIVLAAVPLVSAVAPGPTFEILGQTGHVAEAIVVGVVTATGLAIAGVARWISSRGTSYTPVESYPGPLGRATIAANKRLYWNSRFPDNPGMAIIGRPKPALVQVGSVYVFETALETTTAEGFASTVVAAGQVVGTDIVFSLRGEGTTFSASGPNGLFSEWIESQPLSCTSAGTAVYRAWCRIERPGDILIECLLIVRNAMLLGQEFHLKAYPREQAPLQGRLTLDDVLGRARAKDRAGIESLAEIEAVPEAELRLVLRPAEYAGEDWCSIRVTGRNVKTLEARTRSKRADLIGKPHQLRGLLEELSTRYKPATGGKPFALEPAYADEVKVTFAKIGSALHSMIFAADFSAAKSDADEVAKEVAKQIANQGHGVAERLAFQIDAPNMSIPWALLYDRPACSWGRLGGGPNRHTEPKIAEEVEVDCFWGKRFGIYHWVNGMQTVKKELGAESVRMQPVLDTHLGTQVVRNQRELFASSQSSPVQLDIRAVLTDKVEFLSWIHDLGRERCDILYFFCHASAPSQFDSNLVPANLSHTGEASVSIADKRGGQVRVTIDDMRAELDSELAGRPFVFLNACSSAHSDSVYGAPFVDIFMRTWQGRALVGTEWSVPEAFADPFSRLVVAELRAKKTLSQALETASEAAFEQGNLYPLIYTLYGLSHLQG